MKAKEEIKKVVTFVKKNPIKTVATGVLIWAGLYMYIEYIMIKRKK